MGKYFGTDGFRGEANVDLTVEHAYKVGRFLGWYYGQKAKGERCRIVIGKDTRRSSYMFEYALVSGLTASGADAYLLHVTTTPSVSHVIRTEDFDCGIMISASHNPYYDNGIKVMNGSGEKMEESVILEIEKYLDGGDGRASPGKEGPDRPHPGFRSGKEPLHRISDLHCHPFLQGEEGGAGLRQRKRLLCGKERVRCPGSRYLCDQ